MMTEPELSSAGLPARRAALHAIGAVFDDGATLDDALSLAGLEPRDAGFARALTMATIRGVGRIDAVLKRFLRHPPDPVPRAVLRLGAAELLFMNGAPHAAVDIAVRLVRETDAARASGLVNAVLRKVAGQGPDLLAALDAPRLDTPGWLWGRLSSAYGGRRTRAIASAHAAGAPLDLTVRGDAALWAERLGARVLPNGTLRMAPAGAIEALPGYTEGAWWVQDAAASLPVRMLGEIAGKRVLDLCAAPGGKTLQLAAAGAQVTALDISESRVSRLRDNLKRTGMTADVVVADVRRWRPDERFDAILLDAPCSATGTIRRHPELPHIRDASRLKALTSLQGALLERAKGYLKSDGCLVYAVCSLLPEEGIGRLRDSGWRLDPITAETLIPSAPDAARALIADGALRTTPDHWSGEGGVDGFFAARLHLDHKG